MVGRFGPENEASPNLSARPLWHSSPLHNGGYVLQLAQSPALVRPSLHDEAAAPALIEALHCLRVAVTLFDPAERLVFCGQHLNYLFPSLPPRQDLAGQSYEQLIRLLIAGGELAVANISGIADAMVARCRAQLREGEYQPIDIALSDGRIVEIKARRTRHGSWIALWSDVTAARHAQARLEVAIDLSADAFAFFDKNDRLAMCNDSYAHLYGCASAAHASGKNFRELLTNALRRKLFVTPDDSENWIARWMEMRASTVGVLSVETASGGAYLVRDRATAEGGRVVVFTDVTDHRRAEIALAEQTKALAETRSEAERQANYLADLTRRFDQAAAEADTTKATLLRTMSHELKTPLNAIIGFSDLMLSMSDRFGPEQVKEYASLIHQGGRNLLRLINQILDLTRVASGRYELCRATIDVGALLWQAQAAFEARALAKSIAIEVENAPQGLLVEADENAFTSMVFQLVENAVSFTQEGGKVRLSALRDGAWTRLCVADNGPGVAEADIARILRPFEQGGRGTADHTAGAGLGLTLVKALAELHGGTFAIASAPGEGFSAVIMLPAKPD